jgi:hypothetical protein
VLSMTLLLVSTALTQDAAAARPALEPQVRFHLGAAAVEGPSGFGITGGMDSRLTDKIYVDIAGMVSPIPIPEDTEVEAENNADYFRMRHNLYLAPGLRIPHRQPKDFSWDILFRGGVGVVWSADLDPTALVLEGNHRIELDPAAMGGLDLQFRKDKLGVRLSGKAFVMRVSEPDVRDDIWDWAPQAGLEAFYQF